MPDEGSEPAPHGTAGAGVTAMTGRERMVAALRRQPVDRTPVWFMRQAGRYMKEYRELRAKTGFMDLCKNSDLASEVTVDAAHRLGVDDAQRGLPREGACRGCSGSCGVTLRRNAVGGGRKPD